MDLFARILSEKIRLTRDMVTQSMTQTGYTSFEEYRYNLGYLKALERVLEMMDETRDDIAKD